MNDMSDHSDAAGEDQKDGPAPDTDSVQTLPTCATLADAEVQSGTVTHTTAEDERDEALRLLSQLRLEHRRIDQEISALLETGVTDMLKIGRMKKIKLSIKDQIAYLENQTTPDIIA